jgi:hypothetical protein
MDDVAWDDLPVERIYEYFAHASSLAGVVRAFSELKARLGVEGIALFRALKGKLSSQKTWKARDVLQLLEKRASQPEYMGQRAAEGARVLIEMTDVFASIGL